MLCNFKINDYWNNDSIKYRTKFSWLSNNFSYIQEELFLLKREKKFLYLSLLSPPYYTRIFQDFIKCGHKAFTPFARRYKYDRCIAGSRALPRISPIFSISIPANGRCHFYNPFSIAPLKFTWEIAIQRYPLYLSYNHIFHTYMYTVTFLQKSYPGHFTAFSENRHIFQALVTNVRDCCSFNAFRIVAIRLVKGRLLGRSSRSSSCHRRNDALSARGDADFASSVSCSGNRAKGASATRHRDAIYQQEGSKVESSEKREIY